MPKNKSKIKNLPRRQAGQKSKNKKVKPQTQKESKKSLPKTDSSPKSAKKTVRKADLSFERLLEKYKTSKDDTGSTEVQIILLSQDIWELVKHLKKHKKDFGSKRGLLQMVSRRRRLLNYLQKQDTQKYQKLIEDLGLRK